MPIPDDQDLRPSFTGDNTLSERSHDADKEPGAAGTSEIAMRLSVLGKLVIPPTTHG